MNAKVKLAFDNMQKNSESKRRGGMPADNILIDNIKDNFKKMVKEGFTRIKVFRED